MTASSRRRRSMRSPNWPSPLPPQRLARTSPFLPPPLANPPPTSATGTRGPSSFAESWNDSPTARGAGEATDRFVVTHPFHPLFGQLFELVLVHHRWHEDRVHFRVGESDRAESLPLSWTSLALPDPFRERSAGRAWFWVEDLLRLAALAQTMRHPHGEGGEDGV